MSQNLTQIHQLYAKDLTKAAAIACYKWIGRGQEKAADAAAVAAMRKHFDAINISGRIVVGEGERDEAPMLYVGEQVGAGGQQIDIAVDPLEGTTICASAMPNSISVMAMAHRDCLLYAPDVYMQKIAVGANLPKDVVALEDSVTNNLTNLAKARKCEVSELMICILKRARHDELIAKVRECGARVQLIGDGDVSAAIATTIESTGVDMYIGSGGAPEGVLAAAALACTGGQMQGKLLFESDKEKLRAKETGITDLNRVYDISNMVKGDVIFCATGVTTGWMLPGIKVDRTSIFTSHLIMHRSQSVVSTLTDVENRNVLDG